MGAGSLAVLISDFEPAIPTAGSVLNIRGTVTNTSARPVGEVSVGLRLSSTPLPSRGEIPEILAGAGTRVGFPVAGVADAITEELAAGAVAEFALSVPVDDLGLAAPGVYVTGVEALGSTGAGIVRQDLDRTFLPWWPEGTAVEPLLLTTLWPLVGAPLRDATGTLLSEDPAVEMSPAGRLATLVEAAAAQPGAISLPVRASHLARAAPRWPGSSPASRPPYPSPGPMPRGCSTASRTSWQRDGADCSEPCSHSGRPSTPRRLPSSGAASLPRSLSFRVAPPTSRRWRPWPPGRFR
jgi:hypothetical protein